jgi:acetylornithine deacetylase/succinyl-diaminopimelate desuccinylase-like protein
MTRADEANLSPVKLLSELIRLDTSNPPGNEEIAVQFIESLLAREGIKSLIVTPEPRRANVLARIKGKRAGKPVVLLGHLDVVPAHDEGWIAPPFSGVVRDGFIYGRGAIDMKSQVVCHLISFIMLHRSGVVPERDVIFLATADEEVSGKLGAEYMFQKVDDLGDASFVLSEGGFVMEEEGRLHASISVGEKQVCQFMIRASGRGGHGSMPHNDNANDKVVRAAHRIIETQMPFRPTRIATRYLSGLLKGRRIGKLSFSDLKGALADKGFRRFIEEQPMFKALLKNTVTLTMLKSGDKINVIPTESAAYFDARIFPEVKHDRFLRQMARIAGPDVQLVPVQKTFSIPSSFDTPYFKSIAKAVRQANGPIPVLPYLTTGATDLRHFRAKGVTAYGFFPIRLPGEEHMRMHSVNERLSVESLEDGQRCMDEIVRFLAAYDFPG